REPVHERLSASARRVRAGHAGAGRHPAPPRAGGPPGARRGRLRGRRGRAGGAPPVRRGSPARGSGPGGPGRAGAWVGAPAGGWLLPTMSALLLAASHPPASVLPFALVGLVPMAVRVARLSAGRGGGSAAFRGGLLCGAVHHALLLWWIVPALGWATALAVPAFLAVVAILAAVGGGFGWTLHRALHRAGAPLALALPVAWTAAEWARAHLPGGLAFPWLELGVALA